MKNTNYYFLSFLLGLGFMMACGTATDLTPATTTLTGISVARTTGTGNVTVTAGETLNLTSTFTVTPKPTGAKLGVLSWTVDAKGGSSATATISGATLTAGTTAGDMTLTVKSGTGTTAKSATIDITIEAVAPPALTSFTIGNPSGHALGTPLDLSTLIITTEPATAVTGDLTWSIPTATTGYSITGSTLNSVIAEATGLTVTVQAATTGDAVTVTKVITFPAPALTGFTIGDPSGHALGTPLDLNSLTITTVPATAVTGVLTWTIPHRDLSGYSITGSTLNSGEATKLTIIVEANTSETPPVTARKAITFSAPALASIAVARTVGTGIGTVTVATGGTLDLANTFTVTGSPSTAAVGTLTWTVAAKTDSTATATITDTTLTAGTIAGDMTLTVTTGTGTLAKSATFDITIEATVIAPMSLEITRKTGQISARAFLTEVTDVTTIFDVTPSPANADAAVMWSIERGDAGGTITPEGLYTPANAGSIILKATSITAATVSQLASPLTVSRKLDITVVIDNADSTVSSTRSGSFLATVDGDNKNQFVVWSIEPAVAGAVIIPDYIGAGIFARTLGVLSITTAVEVGTSLNVVATHTADGQTFKDSRIVRVRPGLTSFAIDDPSGHALGTPLYLYDLIIRTVPEAAIFTLKWTIPTTTAGYSITGSTLNSVAAEATTLSVTVQATTAGGTPVTATKTITFPAPALTSIAVARTTGTGTGQVTVPTGGTLNLANTFTVTGEPSTATVDTLTWTVAAKTGSTATATIADGTTTLRAGAVAGDMTLTVTSGTGTTAKSATFDITIESSAPPALESFTIGNPSGHALGTTLDLNTLTITTDPVAAVTGDLTWSIPTATAGYNIASSSSLLASDATAATGLTVIVQATTSGASPKTAMKTITFPAPALTGIAVRRIMGADPVTVPTGGTLNLASTFTVTPSPSTAAVGTLSWTVAAKAGSTATATITGTTLTAGAVAGDMTLTVSSDAVTPAETTTIDITIEASAPPALTGFSIERKSGQGSTKATVGTAIDLSDVFLITPSPPGADASVTWTVKATSAAAGVISGNMLTASAAGIITLVATSTSVSTLTREATIEAENSLSTGPVDRTNANLQGMIVGSTGHFYAHTTTAEKKMTIVIDETTMELSHDATVGSDTELHFKTTDNANTMVLNVPSTGTPSVTSLTLAGHAGAIAAVTIVDHSATPTANEVPLIFEGYETFYGVKRSDYTMPIDNSGDATPEQLAAKIELYRKHYNVVVKGGVNAKLIVMRKMIATDAEKARLEGIWSAANIGYTPPFPEVAANIHPNKFEFTITSRTATEIVVFDPVSTQTLTFSLTTEGGKQKMTLPLKNLGASAIFQDKTTQVDRLKDHHTSFTKEGDSSATKYYKFSDNQKLIDFRTNPLFNGTFTPRMALSESVYNQAINILADSNSGATEVLTRTEAFDMIYPYYRTYQYQEFVLTEIR